MTPAQEATLDEAILQLLEEEDSKFGVNLEGLVAMLPRKSQRVAAEVVDRRLRYLEDEQIGFIRHVGKANQFHTNLLTWRITPAGMNHLRGA